MSGVSEALKASIKALGPTKIPGQLRALEGFNPLLASVSPSRGLAVVHSRYPKETEAALRKLGFKDVGDPDFGLSGPGALIDTAAVAVTPWLVVIGQERQPGDVGTANYTRRNQVVKWLVGDAPNKDEGDNSLESITRVRKVWDETFKKEREAFAALGPDYWDKKKPETYKAYQDIVKGIMDADVVLAQAGLYGSQPSTSTPQQARKNAATASTQTTPAEPQKAPTGAPPQQGNPNTGTAPRADLNSIGIHGLTSGTPEFAAEKQRRLDEWRSLKSKDALKIPQ